MPEARGGWRLSAWCVVAAFGAYFCTYAFRKPFTGGEFKTSIGGFQEMTLLVIAQGLGYTVSKFIGIKVIAEMTPGRRVTSLLALIGFAQVALFFFALTPAPFNCIFLFLNGLPLGIVFGLILGFLEGRRHTEALTAGLCASFIVADGATKSVGMGLLQFGVPEAWMPCIAGLLFVPPLWLFAWMLSRIPAPSREDVAARSVRLPMSRAERWGLFARYAIGLSTLALIYLLLTVLRSVRSDFGRVIWQGLGVTDAPSVFTISESAVALAVALMVGLAVCIRDNRRAFFAALGLAGLGTLLIAAALFGLSAGVLSPLAFMILNGLGLYLPYVVFHTTLFERLIALTRDRGNIGYLMYLVDAVGYLGFAAVMLAKNLLAGPPADPIHQAGSGFAGAMLAAKISPANGNFLDFFVPLSWGIALACLLLLVPCWWYFAVHPATRGPATGDAEVEPMAAEPAAVEA